MGGGLSSSPAFPSHLLVLEGEGAVVVVCVLVDHLGHRDDLVVGVLDGQAQQGVGAVAGDAVHLVIVAGVLRWGERRKKSGGNGRKEKKWKARVYRQERKREGGKWRDSARRESGRKRRWKRKERRKQNGEIMEGEKKMEGKSRWERKKTMQNEKIVNGRRREQSGNIEQTEKKGKKDEKWREK